MLKRILAGALLFSLMTVGYNNPPTVALANQAPQATYCSPPNTIMPGAPVASVPVNQNWAHAEQCGGQLGDLWTDGPFYSPSFSYSGSSYAFTIPANVYVVQGQRVATIDTPLTATASATNYVWLSSKTYQYTLTTTNSAPDSYSVLEYTIVADGSGITGVTNPTLAAFMTNGSVTLSSISSGLCLVTTTGGLIQGTSCSGVGGITSITGTSPITVTAGATPIVSVATPSPSATSTSTTGPPSCAFASTWPYQLACNFPVVPDVLAGNCVTIAPTASPSPGVIVSVTPDPSRNCTLSAAASSETAPGATPGSVTTTTGGEQGQFVAGDYLLSSILDFGATNAGAWTFGNNLFVPGLNDSALSTSKLVCTDGSKNLTTTSCPSPSPSMAPSFENTFKAICIADSYTCNYYPMTETSGTTAYDAIGSNNGTYSGTIESGGSFLTGVPMGVKDGSVGIDFWSYGGNAHMIVESIPTPAPSASPLLTEFAVVRDCGAGIDSGGGANAQYYMSTYDTSNEYNGAGIRTINNGLDTTPASLQFTYGNGSAIEASGQIMITSWASACHPFLIVMEWPGPDYVSGPSAGEVSGLINGIPNIYLTSITNPLSSALVINAAYNGSGYLNAGQGVSYCCVGIVHGTLTFPELQELQQALGI